LTSVKTGFANERYLQALAFAVKKHGDVRQERKGTVFPYVVHPLRVAEILERFRLKRNGAPRYSEDVVMAGLLHDTVEDTATTYEELEEAFGHAVSIYVRAASEEDKALPWRARKALALEKIEGTELDALAIVAADKLDNVRSLVETLASVGEERTWKIFSAPRKEQQWYYRAVAEALLKQDERSLLFRTLDAEVHRVFPDQPRDTRFFAGKRLGTPQDARAYLADPVRNWRRRYSAYELATAWIDSANPPDAVDALLRDAVGEYELVEGFFELETPLGTAGKPSQTDLLLVLRAKGELTVAAIEGKAEEPFGDYVRDWDDGSPGKSIRLKSLKQQLGIPDLDVSDLRYQLLHRTVAAVREAKRYGSRRALMIVHAFDPAPDSFDDFRAFSTALGIETVRKGVLSGKKDLSGVTLRLGWAQDTRR
jgi:HD domain